MGLFSFLKNAGAKIFGGSSAPKYDKVEALKKAVTDLGFSVNDFDLDVDDDTVTVYGTVPTQAEREKIILALGNVDGIATVDDRISVVPPEPEAVPEPEAQFYTVQKGDSLSKIAKAYYGDPMKYPVIFEANKPMLRDPNLIYPGQMLRIPPLD